MGQHLIKMLGMELKANIISANNTQEDDLSILVINSPN